MAICKVPVLSSGFAGGPGYTTFYVRGPDFPMAKLFDFFTSLAGGIPNEVTVSFPLEGVQIDEVTGELAGSWEVDEAQADINGTDSGAYANGVGASIRWNTGVIARSHWVRGRTYVVPFGASNFDVNGRLSSGAVAALDSAAFNLISDLDDSLVVWHRPKGGDPGSAEDVTTATVSLQAAILRSRRP